MSCKLKCPQCKKALKEEGDGTKRSGGEYRVYDSLWNSKQIKSTFRLIKCLECGFATEVIKFDS